MKQYDSIKLEAARFERDAQRINLENAVIEGEKLRKEAAILDIELDTVRIMMITHQGSNINLCKVERNHLKNL